MTERQLWEDRHARERSPAAPSPFVLHHAERAARGRPRGRALDLACGSGRHLRALVDLGFRVVLVDYAHAALTRARSDGLPAMAVQADAASLPFAKRSFDLIVQTRFLDRSIFPALAELLSPGGVLIAETFLLAQNRATGHPRAEFCLASGELERLCNQPSVGLEPFDHHEGVYADTHLGGIAARRP